MAEFVSLYSGSSGNCSVVRSGGAYLMVDMGKGVRVTTGALRALGLEAADCGGILVTHAHSDHVKGLATFLKRHPLPVYATAETLAALEEAGLLPAGCSACVIDPADGAVEQEYYNRIVRLCRENGSGPQAAEGKTRKAETEPAAGALTDGAPHTRETHVRR